MQRKLTEPADKIRAAHVLISAEWHNMFDLPSASLGGYMFIHEQLRGLVGLRTSSQVHP